MAVPANAGIRKLDQGRPMIARGPRGASNSVREQGIVFEALTTHAAALLRTARRHSLCVDDAHDAYQRAMEILLKRAGTLDPDRAVGWLHTVVKHEAMAVRRSRQQLVGGDEVDLDRLEASSTESPEDRVIRWEETNRAAEALKRLKPHERKALWLKATGLSYAEIASQESWTYTKVNRCLAEGRKSFLRRYAGIESGAECERWEPLLSALVDGEASAAEIAEVRPHLRNCASCRATVREMHSVGTSIGAVIPLGLLSAGAASPVGSGLGRLWETFQTLVGERVTTVAAKTQMATEALSGGKVVAVAASAAAMAGGGAAVVVDQPQANDVPTPVRQSVAPRLVQKSMAAVANQARTPTMGRSTPPKRDAERPRRRGVPSDDQVSAEFGPEAVAQSPSAGAVSRANPKTFSAQNGGEFDP